MIQRQHAHGMEMDPRLRAHVLALCGYAPDLIDTLAAIAKSPQPPQPWLAVAEAAGARSDLTGGCRGAGSPESGAGLTLVGNCLSVDL